MSVSSGAEPILEVRNLKTHFVYPTPSPSPKHQGGERGAPSLNRGANRRLLIEICRQKRKAQG